jgi:membrane protein involved in colicin uptake
MNLFTHQIVVAVNEDTEPALGTYGWVWVLAIGIGVFALYKRYQYKQEQAQAAEHHKYMWEQRPGETVEAWQERLKEQELERKERSRQANERAVRRSNRSSRGSSHNRRGDFDPPGGWGGMGPDMG